MYPLDTLWWLSLVWVIVIIAAAFWVAKKDQSARPIGLVAAGAISFISGWTWFTELSVWWAVLVVLLTTALFVVGMLMPDTKDNLWHYGALVVALFGKTLVAAVVATWGMNVPLLVVLVLTAVIITLVVVLVRLLRSPRVKQAMAKSFDDQNEEEEPSDTN